MVLPFGHCFQIGRVVVPFVLVFVVHDPASGYSPKVLLVDNSVGVPPPDVLVT